MPTISSVTTSATGTYTNGQTVLFTINFSESVTIAAGTQIDITSGGSGVVASFAATTATSTNCTYTAGSEIDHDGIDMSSTFSLGAGSVSDVNGNAISNLSFSTPDTSDILINSSGLAVFEWHESASLVTSYDYGNPDTSVTVTFNVKNIGNTISSGRWFCCCDL